MEAVTLYIQISFHTEKALKCLHYLGDRRV
jgi:hypothetical protein